MTGGSPGGRNGALRAGLALGALLCLAGCDSDDPESALSADEYVDVYVELLQAAEAAPDSFAAADSARRILAARGLNEQDLLDFARRHTDDPRVLANAWRRIEDRLRAPQPEDTSATDIGAASVRPGDTAAAPADTLPRADTLPEAETRPQADTTPEGGLTPQADTLRPRERVRRGS